LSEDTNEVVVIDYKTGVRQDKHIKQISEYAMALEKMGKSKIKKVLIYTSEPVKVEVL
jgi:CRISPR/Cas system-associated exonuclease Cas4 (RecB family)